MPAGTIHPGRFRKIRDPACGWSRDRQHRCGSVLWSGDGPDWTVPYNRRSGDGWFFQAIYGWEARPIETKCIVIGRDPLPICFTETGSMTEVRMETSMTSKASQACGRSLPYHSQTGM